MTTRGELDRSISAWLGAEAADGAPDDVLEASRERLRHTKQRRAWTPAWRYSPMNTYAKVAAAVVIVVVIGFAGYQLLPRSGGPGGQPTIAPSPSPSPLARGTFTMVGANVVIDATGGGADVTGRMTATWESGGFTVDLECSNTDAAGLLWIGGDVTESTDKTNAPTGSRVAIVLKRGSPVQGIFVFQFDDPRSASCLAFFDDMAGLGPITTEPIVGAVELAP